MINKARTEEVQKRAKAVGAKGLRVVGSIETGQELLQRFEIDDVFVGLMGNWLAIEPMLAMGAADVLAMEENCSPPAIDMYAEKYQVTLVSIRYLTTLRKWIKWLISLLSLDWRISRSVMAR